MLISKLKEVNRIAQHKVLGSTLKEKILFSRLVLIFFVWEGTGKYSQGPWIWGWVTKPHIFRVFESLSWPNQPLLRGEKEKSGSSSPHVAWHRRKYRCRKEKPLAQDCTVDQQFFTCLNCSWLMPYLSPPLMLGGHDSWSVTGQLWVMSILHWICRWPGNSFLWLERQWVHLLPLAPVDTDEPGFHPVGSFCDAQKKPSKNCSLWLFP